MNPTPDYQPAVSNGRSNAGAVRSWALGLALLLAPGDPRRQARQATAILVCDSAAVTNAVLISNYDEARFRAPFVLAQADV